MKRAFAAIGLFAVLAGTPAFLAATGYPPRLPRVDLPAGGLTSDYLPVEVVLEILAFLVWIAWAYLALAVALRLVASVAVERGVRGAGALAVTSSLLSPGPLRSLVDFAVGSVLVASTLSPRAAGSEPPRRPVAVAATPHEVDLVAAKQPARAQRTHLVEPGDSLWRIAERELGSGFKWRRIYVLNRGRTFPDGRTLSDPRLILPGWRLTLPPSERIAEGTANRQTEDTRLSNGDGRATRQPDALRETPRQTATRVSSPASPRATRPATPALVQRDAPAQPVLKLPSGLSIAASFGCGLLAAELLGRLRRRRSRPALPTAQQADSSDASADVPIVPALRHAGAVPSTSRLDVATDAVVHAWRSHAHTVPRILGALEERDRIVFFLDAESAALPLPSGGELSPTVRFSRVESVVQAEVRPPFPTQLRRIATPLQHGLLAPLARTRNGTALHVGLLASHGVALEGSSSPDSARQVVLSLAAQGSVDDLRVFVLGEIPLGLEELPHVVRRSAWDSAGDLLQELQAEFLRRARLLSDEDAEDIWGHLADHSDEPMPGVVILSTEPPVALRGFVEGVAREACELGGALLAIGWAPSGPSIRASVDGGCRIESRLPARADFEAFLLGPEEAVQAVHVLRGASEEAGDAARSSAAPEEATLHVLPGAPESEPDLTEHDHEREGAPTEQDLDVPAPSPTSVADLEVRCLGPLQVLRAGVPLEERWRRKSRELLAWLVAHPEGAPRERILEDLWPGEEPSRGQNLFDIAGSLLRAKVRTDNRHRYVERIGDNYRLEADAWRVDVWEFDRLVSDGMRPTDPSRAIDLLTKVVTVYQGEFCADCYYPWAEPTRERLRASYVRACARLAELLEKESRHEEALEVLERGVGADQFCEDLWRRAMLVEVAMGRSAAALERYKRIASLLERELEVEPDPESRRLYALISSTTRKRGEREPVVVGEAGTVIVT